MIEVPALTREEKKDLILSVGSHRVERRLSPAEVAALLSRALDAGTTRQELSTLLSVGLSQVGEFLKLMDLTAEVRDMAGWGVRGGSSDNTIPFSSLSQLSKLSASEQIYAAEEILRHGFTWKEVVQLLQLKRRSSKSLQACVAEALDLRPTIETRHVLVGSIHDDELSKSLEKHSQNDRDQLFRAIVNKVPGLADVVTGVRLGAASFVLVSSGDVAKAGDMSAEELEQMLVELTRERVGL